MRVLITGVTGFAGGHLAEALQQQGAVELFGLSRRAEVHKHPGPDGPRLICDLCNVDDLAAILRDVKPERIFHLAGYANTSQSFQDVESAWRGNLDATRGLYDAIIKWGGKPRILFVSSGLIYGDPEREGQPLDESCALRPASPYAASKAAADLASYQYSRFPGLEIVRVRPFNHIGPRQSPQYAVAHFAQQIAAIERGEQDPVLETGNLSSLRDLTDVRDMVQAYVLLMEKGRCGEAYNAASGQAHSMQSILDRLLAQARVKIEVKQQPGLVRAAENRAVRVNPDKLRRETAWAPRFSLEQTLSDILNYWRQPKQEARNKKQETRNTTPGN